MLITQKKRTCQLVNFAVLVDNRVLIKESTKIEKYVNFASEIKKNPWNDKVRVIPIADGVIGWKNVKREINTLNLQENWKKKKTMEDEGDNYTNCDWCFWHGN